MKKINFCLVFSNHHNANFIANILLNQGVMPGYVEHPDKVIEFISNKEVDFLFLDMDFSNESSFDLLNIFKSNENYSSIYIIISSFRPYSYFEKKIKEYNIIGFIPMPFQKKQIDEKLSSILKKFKNHFPTRMHIRIKPNDDELMRLSIKLRNQKRFSAKVIDVSLGGVAALLYSNYDSPELNKGSLIEHITFQVFNKEIDADAKIIKKQNTFIAFKFTHFYNNSNKDLAKYIMKKMSE